MYIFATYVIQLCGLNYCRNYRNDKRIANTAGILYMAYSLDKSASSYLNRREVLVKLGVQRWQLVDGAVEGAVMVSEDLAQEKGSKRHVHHDPLKHSKFTTKF